MTLVRPIDAGAMKSRNAQIERLVKAAVDKISSAVDAGELYLERPLRQLRVAEELLSRDISTSPPPEDNETAA